MKKALLILLIIASPLLSIAQHIGASVNTALSKIDLNKIERTTNGDTTLFMIPVVFHVLHDYGAERVAEATINNALAAINSYFLKTNPDTNLIVKKFRPIIGNAHIAFKLAHTDPDGKPTKGIDYIYTYLSNNAWDQSKLNQWPAQNYLNIWIVNSLEFTSSTISNAGYAYTPSMAQGAPAYDGVLLVAQYMGKQAYDNQCIGRYLGLKDPCGTSYCEDADSIEDTPPCKSLTGTCGVYLYDTSCHDTANVQNIMYANGYACARMFTQGQATYMQSVLGQDIAKRDSLVSSPNLTNTGVNLSEPDVPPVADFNVQNYTAAPHHSLSPTLQVNYYLCEHENFVFINHSWNDTVSNLYWTFSNVAAIPTSTDSVVVNSFSEPGWVNVSLAATSNVGTDTITKGLCVYVADTTNINPEGYYEEFNPSKDVDIWPRFNYFNNNFKWSLSYKTGYYDNYCFEYTGFDDRPSPSNATGKAEGDFDDFFSPAFDLSQLATNANANLNFMYAGTFRTSNAAYMTDKLEIDYSTDCNETWQQLTVLTGSNIGNNGTLNIPYAPLWQGEWKLQSINLPADAKTKRTFFRFRYFPGGYDENGLPISNNFYIDRINISSWPAGVNTLLAEKNNVAVTPNPTKSDAYVVLKTDNNTLAQIKVTDITGRLVYTTQQQVSGISRIEIPATAISTKGIYLVEVCTGAEHHTEKLVVE
ncbi:MAG TPA: T9SS type A sorting domain-containing protein [Flavipsychrobacter sp.]|nr:T9SS type A sorting domain-containing protein [Flavipsychrobacter sp.]